MSGAEVVGFLLGAISLVISAIEHYHDGLEPLYDYSHYQSTLKSLRTRLRIQLSLYEGTLKRLLLSELSPTEADLLFPAADIPLEISLWGDPEIEEKLRSKLGKQYETFMEVVWEMDGVMKKLMSKLDIDLDGKPKWTTESTANAEDAHAQRRARIEWEWRKIRRSFGKKEREGLLQSFERYNGNIASFVQNNEILAPQTVPRTKSFMAYFDTVRKYTLGLYGILETSWKCPCVHTANLRLDGPGMALMGNKTSTFHVCFSYCSEITNEIPESKTIAWKETIVTIDNSAESTALAETNSSAQNFKPRFAARTQEVSIAQPKKTARFSKWFKLPDRKNAEAPPTEITKVCFVPQAAPPVHQISIRTEPKIECLCSAIRIAPKVPKCLGILPGTAQDPCACVKITTTTSQVYEVQRYLNLGSMIVSKSTASSTSVKLGKLSRQQRLGLAVTLASAVLQFYDSPWLDDLWSKQDVCFFLNGINAENRPSISEPFITCTFPSKVAPPQPSTGEPTLHFLSNLIVNKTLFALGIVLIELCLNKPFEDLRSTVATAEGAQGQASVADDYQVAINNIDAVYMKGGSEYGYVVQRCLRCEFGIQESKKRLDLDTFRSLVYEGVVAPLEEDYKKYSLYRGN